MKYIVFLVVTSLMVIRSFEIEDLDREYYIIENKTSMTPEEYNTYTDKDGKPIDIVFEESEVKRELNKGLSLLKKIDNLMKLSSKELIHSDSNNKIVLVPFKHIKMINDDGEISVGNYSGSYIKKDRIIQNYTNGDTCDICKDKKWSATIHYIPDTGEIELSGPVESSTCNYTFTVKGKDLLTEEKYIVLTALEKNTENNYKSTIITPETYPGIDKESITAENTERYSQTIQKEYIVRDYL